MWARRYSLALALAGLSASCARIEFNAGGGGSTSSADGGGGAGGAPTGGGPAGGDGGGIAGGPQGGEGGGPCVPVLETCDGSDEDCNGIVDDPPGGSGDFCGCSWLTYNGKPYVACPTNGQPIERLTCPGGMELVVLQDLAEQQAVAALVPDLLTGGFIGLKQAPLSPDRTAGWQWSGRQGMVPAWGSVEPDDYGLGGTEPARIEDDDEQCGAIFRLEATNAVLGDMDCSGAAVVFLCEASADECVPGGTCLLAEGCRGSFDCALPAGAQCVAAPSAELCNGLDDDCDAMVDDGTCGCTAVTDPNTLRAYKHCTQPLMAGDVHCGPGFRPAMLQSLAEVEFAKTLVVGNGTRRWIGLYQPIGAPTTSGLWAHLDGTPLTIPFWTVGQPNDLDDVENQVQQCTRLEVNGAEDDECSTLEGYLCEQN